MAVAAAALAFFLSMQAGAVVLVAGAAMAGAAMAGAAVAAGAAGKKVSESLSTSSSRSKSYLEDLSSGSYLDTFSQAMTGTSASNGFGRAAFMSAPLEVVDPGTSTESTPETTYIDDVSRPLVPATALYSSAGALLDADVQTDERLRTELDELAREWEMDNLSNGFNEAPPVDNGYHPDPLNDLPPVNGFDTTAFVPPTFPEPPTIVTPVFPTASGIPSSTLR